MLFLYWFTSFHNRFSLFLISYLDIFLSVLFVQVLVLFFRWNISLFCWFEVLKCSRWKKEEKTNAFRQLRVLSLRLANTQDTFNTKNSKRDWSNIKRLLLLQLQILVFSLFKVRPILPLIGLLLFQTRCISMSVVYHFSTRHIRLVSLPLCSHRRMDMYELYKQSI